MENERLQSSVTRVAVTIAFVAAGALLSIFAAIDDDVILRVIGGVVLFMAMAFGTRNME